jgi:hypothetical protein
MTDFINISEKRREELYKNVHEIIQKVTEEKEDILFSDIAVAVYELTIADTLSEYFIVGMHTNRLLEQNISEQKLIQAISNIEKKSKRAD